MSTFSQIAGGLSTIIRKEIAFKKGSLLVGFRALSDLQIDGCESRATAWVIKNGGTLEEAKEGNSRYDRALYAETLKVALIDADSPDDAPRPFVDCSVEDFRSQTDPEMLAYLYAVWQQIQDEVSPRPFSLDAAAFMEKVTEAAGMNDPKALVKYIYSMRLAVQPSCLLTTVSLLFAALRLNSPSSSDVEKPINA